MSPEPGVKCDFCGKAAVAVAGETNGLLVCGDHNDHPLADRAPGHGGNTGLCSEDHFCPGCETGNPCPDGAAIFSHPICGDVACCTSDTPPDRTIPTRASLLAGLAATRAADEKAREQRLPWSAP